MEQIDIEFKESGTSSYSPWHLEIADQLGVSLVTMDDMCWFVRIEEDIFRIRDYREACKLSEFFVALAQMKDKNMLSTEGVKQEVTKVKNNERPEYHLEKCIPLAQFKEKLLRREHGK
jgi:hypothetical protein